MTWRTWLWAIALAIFMYSGPYALPVSFAVVSFSVLTERTALPQRLRWLVGIASFMFASWVIWKAGPILTRIPPHAEPLYIKDFFHHFGPSDFMGPARPVVELVDKRGIRTDGSAKKHVERRAAISFIRVAVCSALAPATTGSGETWLGSSPGAGTSCVPIVMRSHCVWLFPGFS
jgi:hypothetical protein